MKEGKCLSLHNASAHRAINLYYFFGVDFAFFEEHKAALREHLDCY